MIWFYEECKEWFVENEAKYSYAFPNDTEAETKRTIESYETNFKRYETNEEISEAYELEYTGDTYDFCCRRWQIEKARINAFLEKTLSILNQKLLTYEEDAV